LSAFLTLIVSLAIAGGFNYAELCIGDLKPFKFYMISTEKEAVFLKGLKFKNLAIGGIDGERRNAGLKLKRFFKEYNLKDSDLSDFETKAANGFRITYLNHVFYTGEDLTSYLKTKPIKQQLKAFFFILKQLITRKARESKTNFKTRVEILKQKLKRCL
jgi:hypothetical protein